MPATLIAARGFALFGMHFYRERCDCSPPPHNVTKGAPPAILFPGTANPTAPFANAEAFCARLRAVGSRREREPYEGRNRYCNRRG